MALTNIGDISFQERLLSVNYGKGAKERIVPISQRACEWLSVYLAKIRPQLATINSGTRLFVTDYGKPFLPGKLSELVARYVKIAGLKRDGSCHLFRHATGLKCWITMQT